MRATLGILGIGAIGGSIALRARRNGMRVIGADSEEAVLAKAHEVGAIDESGASERLFEEADIVVIAPHLEATVRTLEHLRSTPAAATLIMDVASVKLPVVRAADGLRNFVATHPMAGTERSGVRAARGDLFEGRTWAYAPSNDGALDRRGRDFIESMGALPFAIAADEHDRLVALTSHVPQLVAYYYAALLRQGDWAKAERLCGPVASELLRISTMKFDMWRSVLQTNAANIEPQLRRLVRDLEGAADALAAGGSGSVPTDSSERQAQA
ncbi:MAG: prephenate dehydrogenase/arogenate dehydrogenase family protein [Candidatus Eremiobacteraeota bacterium]|nr:prephenate dehydrogenase/arogenate dehydrogenase family protein [Candidatus Eremiobacteraeota bacterium]